MSTIQVKGSSKRVNLFIMEKRRLLNNDSDNKIVVSYYNYLISINNKEHTIHIKIRFIYLFNQYLFSIRDFSKINLTI